MPPIRSRGGIGRSPPISDDLQSKGSNQGWAASRRAAVVLNVLVGDVKAGQQYFAKQCSACRSPSGDLQGIGTRSRHEGASEHLGVRRLGAYARARWADVGEAAGRAESRPSRAYG